MHIVKLTALFSCLALSACTNLSGKPESNDSMMAYVSDSQRDMINESRAELYERNDNLAIARQDVVLAKAELNLARSELDMVKARIDRAEASVAVAQSGTDADLEAANARLLAAKAEVEPQNELISWRELEIARCQKAETLARRERDLATARVELVKARAFAESGRAGSSEVDVTANEERVREFEKQVALAVVELDAATTESAVAERRFETAMGDVEAR